SPAPRCAGLACVTRVPRGLRRVEEKPRLRAVCQRDPQVDVVDIITLRRALDGIGLEREPAAVGRPSRVRGVEVAADADAVLSAPSAPPLAMSPLTSMPPSVGPGEGRHSEVSTSLR